MRTIAVVNQKGGCGKTTVSINLASALADVGKKVLLVDMDPQSHCAVGLAVPEEQIEQSIYDVLISESRNEPMRLTEILWQIGDRLELAPASIDLSAFEQQMAGIPERECCLKKVLDAVTSDYDFVVIDCPPAVSLLTFNALRAATDVVVPVETGYFALHGLSKQLETLSILCKRCQQEVSVRVLASMYDIRTKMAREILAELRAHFSARMFKTVVNFNTKIKEAASFGQPINEYDPASKGQQDFRSLAQELIGSEERSVTKSKRLVDSLADQLESIGSTATELLRTSQRPAEAEAGSQAQGQRPANVPGGAEAPRSGQARPGVGVQGAAQVASQAQAGGQPAGQGQGHRPGHVDGRGPVQGPGQIPARPEGDGQRQGQHPGHVEVRGQGQGSRPAEVLLRAGSEVPVQGSAQVSSMPQTQGQVETAHQGQGSSEVQGQRVAQGPSTSQVQGQVQLQGQRDGEPGVEAQRQAAGQGQVQGQPRGQVQAPAAGQGQGQTQSQGQGAVRPEWQVGGPAQGQVQRPYEGVAEVRAVEPTVAEQRVEPEPEIIPVAEIGQTLDTKLSDYYGVNQIRDAVVFVTLYPRAANVQIAGDFNNWQPGATTMERVGDSGVWQAKLKLPNGTYRYRLVVDGQWQQDPYNERTEMNPYGELNSVVEIQ